MAGGFEKEMSDFKSIEINIMAIIVIGLVIFFVGGIVEPKWYACDTIIDPKWKIDCKTSTTNEYQIHVIHGAFLIITIPVVALIMMIYHSDRKNKKTSKNQVDEK